MQRINTRVSGIIPTLGRPQHLRKCLECVARQTVLPMEVLVVHCGTDSETQSVVEDPMWRESGVECRYFHYPERNAAAQRNFAIAKARGQWLLLLDDDLEIEPEWTERLLEPMTGDDHVAATLGNLVNQPYALPNSVTWRLYYRLIIGGRPIDHEGQLVGAAINLGYERLPDSPRAIEWIGAGASIVRRSAFEEVGGFAPYFSGNSPGEDFDLGFRLSRRWKVLFVPTARAFHHSAGQNRSTPFSQQYQLIRSKFAIQLCAMKRPRAVSLWHTAVWAIFQSASEIMATLRGKGTSVLPRLTGRFRGLASCVFWRPLRQTS